MITLKATQANYKVRVKDTLVRFGANGNANIEDHEIADTLIKAGFEVVGGVKEITSNPVVEEVFTETFEAAVEDVVEKTNQPRRKKKKK